MMIAVTTITPPVGSAFVLVIIVLMPVNRSVYGFGVKESVEVVHRETIVELNFGGMGRRLKGVEEALRVAQGRRLHALWAGVSWAVVSDQPASCPTASVSPGDDSVWSGV